MVQSRTFKSLILLILLGFIWGAGYSLAKYAITHGVTPLGYGFWQAIGPAFILTLICCITQKRALVQIHHWGYFACCGLLGIAIPNTNIYFASSHLSSGLLAVLVNTVPLFVYPLALLTRQEKSDIWRFLALLLSIAGICLIIGITNSDVGSIWCLLALISPLSFACCSVYINHKAPNSVSSIEAASGMLIAASVFLLPMAMSEGNFYPLWGTFDLTRQVVVLEIILSSIGYLLFFKLLRVAGPVFYSLTGGIVALTGLFWGYCVFDEIPTGYQSFGIVLVISGVFLLSWRQSKH